MDGGTLLDAAAFLVRELALFAAVGFVILGASDLLVDFIWIGLKLKRLLLRVPHTTLADLPAPERPGPLAVFIPAWQESEVIGAMLRHALGAWRRGDVRLYVGCYPNDPATTAAVTAIDDPRIRLVIGDRPGPTTKADNLNTIWRALRADEEAAPGPFKGIVVAGQKFRPEIRPSAAL